MIYVCARAGCGARHRAGAKYCSERCGAAERQHRYRERMAQGAEVEISVSVSITHTERRRPQAFGVDTTADVAAVFADDRERFRQMGYVGP
jgi:predicted nucleic acid-binding Zn ribbon protein